MSKLEKEPEAEDSDPIFFGNNLGTKPTKFSPFDGLRAPYGQLNQRDFGGSVWESNPPFDPLRTESPALKAGEITGPLSPPKEV